MSQPDGQGTPYPHGDSSGTPYPHGDSGGQPQGPTTASAPQAPGAGWTQVDDHTYVSPDGQRITMYGTSSTGTVLRQEVENRIKQDSGDVLAEGTVENPILKAFGVDSVPLPKTLANIIADIKLKLTADQQYQQSLQQQAAQLAQGLNLRSSPSMPASSYSGVAHPELKRMVTDGIDPATAGENGQNLITTGNEMTQHQQTFASAITRSQSGWEGSAGDSARDYMGKLTNYVGEAGRGVQLSGTQLSRQSEALSLAKHAMPEPVNFDAAAANARLQQLSGDPFAQWAQYAEDMKQYQAQQAAQQHAAEVVQTYDNSLGGSTTAPAFATPPTFGDSGAGHGRDGHSGGSGSGAGHAAPHIGGSAGAGSQPGGSGGNTPKVSSGGPGRSGVLPGVTSGASAGSGYPAGFPGGVGGEPSSGGRYVGSSGDLGAPVPFGGGGIPIGGGDAVRGGAGGGGSIGAGGAGAASSSGGAQTGAGARSGAGAAAGAAAAEEAAMQRGAAGARGAAGGVGGMGAGRGGKKDEDAEHESPSWLVEPDPDSLFGTDEKTAPPVIGG